MFSLRVYDHTYCDTQGTCASEGVKSAGAGRGMPPFVLLVLKPQIDLYPKASMGCVVKFALKLLKGVLHEE